MFSWEYPPRVIGGLARHVAELSMALQAENTQVDVITIDEEGTAAEAKSSTGACVAHTPLPPCAQGLYLRHFTV